MSFSYSVHTFNEIKNVPETAELVKQWRFVLQERMPQAGSRWEMLLYYHKRVYPQSSFFCKHFHCPTRDKVRALHYIEDPRATPTCQCLTVRTQHHHEDPLQGNSEVLSVTGLAHTFNFLQASCLVQNLSLTESFMCALGLTVNWFYCDTNVKFIEIIMVSI